LATPITLDVLMRAGISGSLAPRTLRSLEMLDLIDEQGNPTHDLEGLRRVSSDDFRQRLEAIVRGAYAEVFQFTDPAKDDSARIADAFRAYEPLGQRGRMVTLFLGLCEAAGIIPEGAGRKQAPSHAIRPAKPRRMVETLASAAQRERGEQGQKRPAATGLPPAIEGLLASLPPNGQGWTAEQREKFMATFGTVLDFVIPIRDEEPQGEDEPDDD
jgi:hypothetical protein